MGVALLLLPIVMNIKNELFLFLQWKQDGNLWEESRGMSCTCQLVVMSFRVHACTVRSDCILHSPHYKTSCLSFIIILTPLLYILTFFHQSLVSMFTQVSAPD